MPIYSVYRITNLVNSKVYIGFTSQKPNARWRAHVRTSKDLTKNHSIIHRAMAKHGIENFTFEVIYQSKMKDHTLTEMEQLFIIQHDAMVPNGYNVSVGGSATMLGKTGESNWRYGTKLSEEHKRNIAQGGTGRTPSEDTRMKLSVSKSGENHPLFGKPRSTELKNLHSSLMSGSGNPMYGRRISEASMQKRRETLANLPFIKCPHCEKESRSAANMSRYHFDKCNRVQG